MADKFDTKYTRNTKDECYSFDPKIYAKDLPKYHLEIDDYGHQALVEEEEKDQWYDKIQSYHDGCSLKALLERYKETGDPSVLQKVQGQYFNTSGMPTDMLGMYKKTKQAEQDFNNLPLEVRQKFNNSFGEFLAKGGMYEPIDISGKSVNVSSVDHNSISDKVEKESENNDK